MKLSLFSFMIGILGAHLAIASPELCQLKLHRPEVQQPQSENLSVEHSTNLPADLSVSLWPDPNLKDYQIRPATIGQGYSGTVYQGTLPGTYRTHIEDYPLDWNPGQTPLAIKASKPKLIHQQTLLYEFKMAQLIKKWDTKGLFMRYAFDKTNHLLLSSYDSTYVNLESWLELPITPSERHKVIVEIEIQLKEALDILKNAQIVHSDLNLKNVLINTNDSSIKVIDFGIAAKLDDYAEPRKHLTENRRGGIFKSPNQEADGPAQFEDDQYAVKQMIQTLQTIITTEENSHDTH